MKVRNRFYVAAHRMTEQMNAPHPEWSHPTLEAAIKHGESILQDEDSRMTDTDTVAIVQIVRVLRRKRNPIQVEKVE